MSILRCRFATLGMDLRRPVARCHGSIVSRPRGDFQRVREIPLVPVVRISRTLRPSVLGRRMIKWRRSDGWSCRESIRGEGVWIGYLMSPMLRHVGESRYLGHLVFRALDALCILAGLVAGVRAVGQSSGERQLVAGVAAVVVYYLVAEVTGLYRSWRGASTEREVACALVTWALSLPGLATLGFLFQHTDVLPRPVLAFWLVTTPLLSSALRVAVRFVQKLARARGLNTRRYAVVGINELGFQLVRNIERSVGLGLKFVGFYDDRPEERTPQVPKDLGPKVGDLGELVEHTRQRKVDIVYITFPMRAEDRIRGILGQLGDTTASVYIVPDFFVFQLLHSRWIAINGLPVVSIFETPFYGIDGFIKRAVDLVLGSLLLAAAALPMLVIAVLVKLTSPGPVFFRQRRYGLDGREILVWKFRSMHVCEDGREVKQARRNDPRVTPIGAFLRRTSLDELPQLFNVLAGTMSLVGPRPHANTHNELYRKLIDGYMLRHKVKPGITGLAQVNGLRGETDTLEKMERRVAFDHQYIRDWSLWMDLKILLRTVFVVLSGRNAY